jgi:bacterioferritin
MNKLLLMFLIIIGIGVGIHLKYPQTLNNLKKQFFTKQKDDIAMKNLSADEKNDIVKMLNSALADEWLAYYQYWIGAYVVKSNIAEKIKFELNEHAREEYEHAEKLAVRILQLGGIPLLHPQDWFKETHCGFMAPENPEGLIVLDQNIKGEQCAIKAYTEILEAIGDKDPVTTDLVKDIIKDEEKHEKDLKELVALEPK